MASNRNPRNPRIGDIPQDYMSNWQCPSAEGLRTLVRRPMTACEACRAMKAKCDGKQSCRRCTTRGIACRYPTNKAADSTKRPHSRRSSTGAWRSPHHPQPDEGSMSTANAIDMVGHEGIASSMSDTQTEMSWINDMSPHELDFLNWSPESMGLNQDGPVLDPIPSMSQDNVDLVRSLTENSLPQTLLQATPAYLTSIQATDAHSLPPSPADLQYPTMMNSFSTSTEPCLCRTGPVLIGPKIRRALQTKRFDELLKVTGDAIKSCQTMIDCGHCQLSSPDLICAITIFQETSVCFKQITKPDSSSVVKLIVGGYEVSVTDRDKLRSVLIMDLVKQANSLLDSMSNIGENMFLNRPSPDRLAQVHFNYLRELTQDFRDTLRFVTDSLFEVDPHAAG
ncbi:hypothetical protein F4805DRAFT_472067 [Annulohypoxylon moriforme]|nr:hypothetical protein F4805DRAFT_472067 [Annulohypoxylon moriforme]